MSESTFDPFAIVKSEPEIDPFYILPDDTDNRALPERDIMADKEGFRASDSYGTPSLVAETPVDDEAGRRIYAADIVKASFKTDDSNHLLNALILVDRWLRDGTTPQDVPGAPSEPQDGHPGVTEPDDPTEPQTGTQSLTRPVDHHQV